MLRPNSSLDIYRPFNLAYRERPRNNIGAYVRIETYQVVASRMRKPVDQLQFWQGAWHDWILCKIAWNNSI